MTLVVTQAGLDKATQASLQGINFKITHVALGSNGYTPDNSMTALQNESVRVAISGGKQIATNHLHLTALFDGEDEIIAREIGFYLEDGTLFAIDSHPSEILVYKSSSNGSRALEGFDLILDAVPTDSIAVDTTGDLVINYDREFGALQFAPYDPERIYKTGETCTIEVAGEIIAMQMYAGPNLTCVGKDPADLTNRHEQWADPASPFWWIPFTGTEVGMPFWWLDTLPPETAVMEINADLPTAVYWRLARRYPDLVTGETINTGEIRGEFLRVLDQGRGVDVNRLINRSQDHAVELHNHRLPTGMGNDGNSLEVYGLTDSYWGQFVNFNSDPGGGVAVTAHSGANTSTNNHGQTQGNWDAETRPRNIARAMAITI